MEKICDNRVVIITGAGRGLGRAYALGLAAQGASIVVNDLGVGTHGDPTQERPAEDIAAQIRQAGGDAIANFDDVADWEGSARLVKTAIDHFGRLDAVVNNAGFVRDRMFVSCTPEEWDAVIRVHLRGHFCVSRHAVDYWRDQFKAGSKVDARIINTSSGAGLQGSIGQSAYSAAKAGIATLTLVQAAELARYGITVNGLAPNARTRMTETAFAEAMKAKEGEFDIFAPENTVPLVAWLASTQSADITGQIFELIGGKIRLALGWTDGPEEDRNSRWDAANLGEAITRLVAERPAPKPVYGSS